MGRSARVLGLLRPYTLLFAVNIVATVLSSLMDGATFVLLIPFLRALFKLQALPPTGSSAVEEVLGRIAGPLLTVGAPEVALRNVVLVLLIALVIKNAAAYGAVMSSVAIEEGVVRDLRVRLFRHRRRCRSASSSAPRAASSSPASSATPIRSRRPSRRRSRRS